MAGNIEKTQNIDEIISAAQTTNKYKTIEVNKAIEPHTDLGNLLITDINLIGRQNFG
jgi:cellulase/cellobiase CelA1